MLTTCTKTSPNVTFESAPGGRCTVRSPGRQLTLVDVTQQALNVFRRLSERGVDEHDLQRECASGTHEERLQLHAHIDTLLRHGYLRRTLHRGEQPVASRVVSRYFRPCAFDSRASYRLSRFAVCHADCDGLLIESPRCYAQVILHDAGSATLLAAATQASLVAAALTDEVERAVVQLLAESGLLVLAAEDGATVEDGDPTLRQWEFQDLLFHGRSRAGRHSNAVGATYRFRDDIERPPALKPPMSDQVVSLYRPNLAELRRTDKSLTEVLESRRSLRAERSTPPTLRELGEFLFRTARVQKQDEASATTWRPTPSGGSLHELEIYVVAYRCKGLEAGLYHYSPLEHQLEALGVAAEKLEPLMDDAAMSQGVDHRANLLLLVTARFQRVSWKYSSIAYALILKNVGALFQTMYLVATAMGMAPCAIGVGDSELFARIAKLRFEEEGTVGEFTLR